MASEEETDALHADRSGPGDDDATVISGPAAEKRVIGAESVPDRIGGFRIVSPLGAGGMGIVYAAVQDQPRRTVALKILRPDLLTEELQRRFDTEAEVLGRLQHEGIARIYETGRFVTAFGPQPYYAMELVEGVDIVTFADNHSLDVEGRVELLLDLIEAVHAAHMKGVIHRDLKPANVLVTDEGKVKVLDFGLARLTDSAKDAMRTMTGQLVGTLNYMSPEQAAGRNDAVDVRADVYSLGVILYRLLTGALPIDTRNMPLAEAVDVIQQQEPPSLGHHDVRLRGDLDYVVGMALSKDVNRRYESAAAFGVDLRNYLAHDVVTARPPSGLYRMSRFARRHRAVVASASVVFVFLALATVVSLRFAFDARKQAELAEQAGITASEAAARAEREATARLDAARRAEEAAAATLRQVDRTRRFSGFIIDTFSNLDPAAGRGREMTLREALLEVEKKFEDALDDDPESRTQIHNMFGQLWRTFGDYDRARHHAEAAVELANHAEVPEELTGVALQTLAWIEYRAGRFEEAVDDLETSLEIFTETGFERSLSYAWGVSTLAEIASVRRQHERAEQLALQALALRTELVGGDHREVAESHFILSYIYTRMGRRHEARKHGQAALAMRRRLYGDDNPIVAESLSNLAECALLDDDLETASELLEKSYRIQSRTLDPNNRAIAVAEVNLGYLAFERRDLEAAKSWYEKATATFTRIFGPDCIEMADVDIKSALVHRLDGDLKTGRRLAEKALAACRERPGLDPGSHFAAAVELAGYVRESDPLAAGEYILEGATAEADLRGAAAPGVIQTLNAAALCFRDAERPERAIAVLRTAIERCRTAGLRGDEYGASLAKLGALLGDRDEFEEAEKVLLECLEVVAGIADEVGEERNEAVRACLVKLYEKWGKPDQAALHREDD